MIRSALYSDLDNFGPTHDEIENLSSTQKLLAQCQSQTTQEHVINFELSQQCAAHIASLPLICDSTFDDYDYESQGLTPLLDQHQLYICPNRIQTINEFQHNVPLLEHPYNNEISKRFSNRHFDPYPSTFTVNNQYNEYDDSNAYVNDAYYLDDNWDENAIDVEDLFIVNENNGNQWLSQPNGNGNYSTNSNARGISIPELLVTSMQNEQQHTEQHMDFDDDLDFSLSVIPATIFNERQIKRNQGLPLGQTRDAIFNAINAQSERTQQVKRNRRQSLSESKGGDIGHSSSHTNTISGQNEQEQINTEMGCSLSVIPATNFNENNARLKSIRKATNAHAQSEILTKMQIRLSEETLSQPKSPVLNNNQNGINEVTTIIQKPSFKNQNKSNDESDVSPQPTIVIPETNTEISTADDTILPRTKCDQSKNRSIQFQLISASKLNEICSQCYKIITEPEIIDDSEKNETKSSENNNELITSSRRLVTFSESSQTSLSFEKSSMNLKITRNASTSIASEKLFGITPSDNLGSSYFNGTSTTNYSKNKVTSNACENIEENKKIPAKSPPKEIPVKRKISSDVFISPRSTEDSLLSYFSNEYHRKRSRIQQSASDIFCEDNTEEGNNSNLNKINYREADSGIKPTNNSNNNDQPVLYAQSSFPTLSYPFSDLELKKNNDFASNNNGNESMHRIIKTSSENDMFLAAFSVEQTNARFEGNVEEPISSIASTYASVSYPYDDLRQGKIYTFFFLKTGGY